MNTLFTRNVENELELAAEALSNATHLEAETGVAKRWHYLDAWLYTQSSGWQRVDFTKDLFTGMPKNMFFGRAEAAALKSTWQLKWSAEAKREAEQRSFVAGFGQVRSGSIVTTIRFNFAIDVATEAHRKASWR